MERLGIGFGKLLLLGEHAAVYGHPAVGLTLPARVRVLVAETGELGYRFAAGDAEALGAFFDRFREAAGLGAEGGGVVRVDSTLPKASGFGSSAALCVAFAEAFAPPGAGKEAVWASANRAERYFHGTPSGVDTGLALLRGLYAFLPSPPGLPEARELPGASLPLVVGAVPRSASTARLVGELRLRIEAGDVEARARLESLGSIASEAIELLGARGTASPARLLGALFLRAHTELRSLGLSAPSLDSLIEAGMRLGALGGKLSGGGGGGAFFLLFASREEAERAAQRLAEHAERNGIAFQAPPFAWCWTPA